MKKAHVISMFCALLFLFGTGSVLAEVTDTCDRAVGQRLETAQALVTVNAGNYESRINYWAVDVTYREPVFTNIGRDEMYEYLQAVFGGTAYGFPDDKVVTIKHEVSGTDAEGNWTYMAAIEWSGTFGTEFFFQTGMSIVKFRPGEGCPYYHRDFFSEGDTWWNIPGFQPLIMEFRCFWNDFIDQNGACFDEDGDGYTKYKYSTGCPNEGLDCNDFVSGINPGVTEIPGNGIDEDCNPETGP